jgi:hypothetical protein
VREMYLLLPDGHKLILVALLVERGQRRADLWSSVSERARAVDARAQAVGQSSSGTRTRAPQSERTWQKLSSGFEAGARSLLSSLRLSRAVAMMAGRAGLEIVVVVRSNRATSSPRRPGRMGSINNPHPHPLGQENP